MSDSEPSTTENKSPLRLSWTACATFTLTGMVLPCCAAILAFLDDPGHNGESWQSGKVMEYLSLVVNYRGALAFLPLLGLGMVSLVLLLKDFERWSGAFWVRLGIYGGVLLTGQTPLVWSLDAGSAVGPAGWLIFIMFAGLVTLGLTTLMWHIAAPRHGRVAIMFSRDVNLALAALSLAAALVCFTTAVRLGVEGACRAFSPFLALATYSAVSLRISPPGDGRSRFSLSHLLGSIGWLSAYLASWRWAVEAAIEQYATLPTTPPSGCYVCTAAARGHRRLVGSEEIASCYGQIALVNLQLRRLKCCELALRAWSPRMHRLLRAIYDRVGPRLAACCVHPLLADVAYVSLKPLEWLIVGRLRRLLPNFDALAARLYRGPQ